MSKKILIADDDAELRSMIRKALEQSGQYEYEFTSTTEGTREMIPRFKPDLLIIYEMDGGGVAFGDKQYELGNLVIITSADIQSNSGAPQIQRGSVGFRERLLAMIAELLASRS